MVDMCSMSAHFHRLMSMPATVSLPRRCRKVLKRSGIGGASSRRP